jgi:class 3 adenylate cyclase
MARLQRKRFSEPSEVREAGRGRVEVVELDDVVVGRMIQEPGWRWSIDVKPIAGTDRCQYHHLGFAVSGRLRVEMPDGTEMEIGPGDVFEIPPGHEAWVPGDEPWVAIDFAGMRTYARPPDARNERILASLLFTDIVDSTATAERLGEAAWRSLLGRHNEAAQQVVDRHRGSVVKFTGDGMLASFDGAERAVLAARDLRDRIGRIDLRVRQGLHTGEVEPIPGDLRGVAVHLAARVMSLAGPGEIFVSSTAYDLLDGSGFTFEDRGDFELKGFSGKRRVYAVTN